jgi:integral membrane sensor domain MASE1
VTWWLGDFAGALIVTPLLVLCAINPLKPLPDGTWRDTIFALTGAVLVGLIAFSPLLGGFHRGPWGFLALLPLI